MLEERFIKILTPFNHYYKKKNYIYLREFNSVDRDIAYYMYGLWFKPHTLNFSIFKCVMDRLLDPKKNYI